MDKKLLSYAQIAEDHGVLSDHPEKEGYQEKFDQLAKIINPETLSSIMPDPELRPLLFSAVLHQLDTLDFTAEAQAIQALTHTKVLELLNTPYKPVFIEDIIDRFKKQAESGEDFSEASELYCDLLMHPERGLEGLNSTLKNLIIATILNETVLKNTANKAKIALAQYTWEGLRGIVSKGEMPTLPEGTDKKTYLKFMVAIENQETGEVDYCDYGQGENLKKYDSNPTGEGIENVVGMPVFAQKFIDPENIKDVVRALQKVAKTQANEADREAIRRLGLHIAIKRKLVDFCENEKINNFPDILSGLDDMTEEQIDSVLSVANFAKQAWGKSLQITDDNKTSAGQFGVVYSEFKGKNGLVNMAQPSTRTITASKQALEALGMNVQTALSGASSQAKGESLVSEDAAFSAHDFDVVLARSKSFETDAEELKKANDLSSKPSRISLGGDIHHPTQTLGEILAFMDIYGCKTVAELREKTAELKPKIIFMGHTKNKRADKALIKFILKHLPGFEVVNYVPLHPNASEGESYNPQIEGLTVIEDDQLLDQEHVQNISSDADFIYISNPEGTSGDGGKGAGKKVVDYHLSAPTVEKNNIHVMAPLPASGELDSEIFTHPNSLIDQQMKNKVAVITSLVAHQLSVKKRVKK